MSNLLSRISLFHVKQAYRTFLEESVPHIERTKRVERAYEILTKDERYTIELKSNKPLSFSISGPNDTYTVIESQQLCTCPDSDIVCKHRFAVKMLLLASQNMKRDGLSIKIKENE
jgi:hypothetical protein